MGILKELFEIFTKRKEEYDKKLKAKADLDSNNKPKIKNIKVKYNENNKFQ